MCFGPSFLERFAFFTLDGCWSNDVHFLTVSSVIASSFQVQAGDSRFSEQGKVVLGSKLGQLDLTVLTRASVQFLH